MSSVLSSSFSPSPFKKLLLISDLVVLISKFLDPSCSILYLLCTCKYMPVQKYLEKIGSSNIYDITSYTNVSTEVKLSKTSYFNFIRNWRYSFLSSNTNDSNILYSLPHINKLVIEPHEDVFSVLTKIKFPISIKTLQFKFKHKSKHDLIYSKTFKNVLQHSLYSLSNLITLDIEYIKEIKDWSDIHMPSSLRIVNLNRCEILPHFNEEQLESLKLNTGFEYGVASFQFPSRIKSLNINIVPSETNDVPQDIFSLKFPLHLTKLNLEFYVKVASKRDYFNFPESLNELEMKLFHVESTEYSNLFTFPSHLLRLKYGSNTSDTYWFDPPIQSLLSNYTLFPPQLQDLSIINN